MVEREHRALMSKLDAALARAATAEFKLAEVERREERQRPVIEVAWEVVEQAVSASSFVDERDVPEEVKRLRNLLLALADPHEAEPTEEGRA